MTRRLNYNGDTSGTNLIVYYVSRARTEAVTHCKKMYALLCTVSFSSVYL